MKANRLSLLAVVTVIVVGMAILLARQDALQTSRDRMLLFPGLREKINDLSEMTIQSKEQSLSLIRQDGEWKIKEADGYPARFDKIKQTAVALSDLRILAEKTSKPTLYEKLGVEDPLSEGASSLLLTLRDDAKNPLLGLIIGKARQNQAPGRYVRLPESRQALLVEADLAVSLEPKDWLARDLLNISADRIRSIEIQHSDDAELSIQRDHRESAFNLENLPDGRTADTAAIGRVPSLLESIYIDNVKADSGQFTNAASIITTVKTFDGLIVRVNSTEADGRSYIKLDFSYAGPMLAEKDAQNTEASGEALETVTDEPDVQAEVKKLNKLVSGWYYQIPNYRFELFRTQMQELLVAEDEERKTEDRL